MARDFKNGITVNGTAVSLSSHTHAGGDGVYAATIGDGTSVAFDITHNLGTRDVIVRCYVNSGAYEDLQPAVTRPSTSVVRLYFMSAPSSNSVRVVVRA